MAGESAKPTLSRRACLRLTILGAAGLSLLPSCRQRATPTSTLDKWAELGRIWRGMRGYWRAGRWTDRRYSQFKHLRTRTDAALAAVQASPELREVFVAEAAELETKFGMAAASRRGITCYEMVASASTFAHPEIERQAAELEALASSGKLSKPAMVKAAQALAVQAEYVARYAEAKQAPATGGGGAPGPSWDDYRAGRVKPGAPAVLAGERLAEMTVDRLEMIRPLPVAQPGSAPPKASGEP
jgi:hypothetical protein